MIKYSALALALLSITGTATAVECKAVFGDGQQQFSLATGSPGELGLLEQLAVTFGKQHDARMCWIKAGSGKSLKLLKNDKVDMVMVHAPAAEQQAVNEGWATQHTLIGANEFYLVGPAKDNGKVKGAQTVAQAYSNIAAHKAAFYSRGDNSGTHKKEMAIWNSAKVSPAGEWYRTTNDFMRASLKLADANHGYFMTDSSTYVATKSQLNNSEILFKGDPVLINTYHALRDTDLGNNGVKLSQQFIEFVASPAGQQIITNYGKAQYGAAMYENAKAAEKYVH